MSEDYPFGDLLRGFRQRARMSQQTLAESLGKHRNTIRMWERGDYRPDTYADVVEIAQALALSQQDQAALLSTYTGTDVVTHAMPTKYSVSPEEVAVTRTHEAIPPSFVPLHSSSSKNMAITLGIPESEPLWKVPPSLTPLLGRELDVEEACALLVRPEIRFLTLVGTGGVGKTRLAQQIAVVLRDSFINGVCFVELAAIRDPSLVMQTIAHRLGLLEGGTQSLIEQVKGMLQSKHLLLLLDNFEQVVTAAPLIEELVTACSLVKVVVTSRMVLHLQVEQLFPVLPLKLPNLNNASETVFDESAAVQLFIQRAQAVLPTFQLTPSNARTIAEICVQLDGLPLAIELAAVRIRLLSSQALLTRLSQRLSLLTGGAQTLPTRQQTLRNTLAWSYGLLDEQEQRLFRRLAIFVGGCTLQTAERLCESIGSGSVLDEITSLFDKSLLQRIDQDREQEEEPRFLMLETIREYGLELLHVHGEYQIARSIHAQYILQLAEEAEPHLRRGTVQQMLWRKCLEKEQENLRAALHWLIEAKDVERALRLSRIAGYFWSTQGFVGEARQWLETALQLTWTDEHRAARAALLSRGGDITWRQGDFASARTMLEESVTLYRSVEEISLLAFSLGQLGRLLCDRGDVVAGEIQFEESIELSRRMGDQWLLASVLGMYGRIKRKQGDFKEACKLLEQSTSILYEIGDTNQLMVALRLLGETLLALGRWKKAQEYFQESLRLIEQGASPLSRCYVLLGLGDIAMGEGDWTQAESLYTQNLSLAQKMDFAPHISNAFIALAHLKRCQGNLIDATLLVKEGRVLIGEDGKTELISLQFLVLAEIARDRGDLLQANALFEQGLSFVQGKGYQPIIGWFLIGLATIAQAAGKLLQAAHLLGLAESLHEKTAVMDHKRQTECEDTTRSVREHLGDDVFIAAKIEGSKLSLEQLNVL